MRGLAATGGEDGVADASHALKDAMIVEADHPKAVGFEEGRSPGVISCGFFSVRPAVDLDDEPKFRAVEIYNVVLNTVLPAKLPAFQLLFAQILPERFFGGCLIFAKFLPVDFEVGEILELVFAHPLFFTDAATAGRISRFL